MSRFHAATRKHRILAMSYCPWPPREMELAVGGCSAYEEGETALLTVYATDGGILQGDEQARCLELSLNEAQVRELHARLTAWLADR